MIRMIFRLHKINAFEFFTVLIILTVFFQDLICATFNTKVFKSLDEIFILLIISVLLIEVFLRGRINVFYLNLILVFIYLVLVSLFFGYQVSFTNVIIQSIIHLKFFIFFSFFHFYIKKEYDIKLLVVLKYIVCIAILGVVFELFFKNGFYDFMQIDDYLRPLAKKDKVVYGGFVKANVLSFLFLIYFVIRSNDVKFSYTKYWIWFFIIFLFFIAVKSRTALIMLFILPFIKFRQIIFQPKYLFSALFAVIVSFIFVYYKTNFIEKTVRNLSLFFTQDSYYIRGIMYFLSGRIFIDYFPIGTGAATFGTVLSENSVVYEIYNVAHRSFFIKMDGVYDSNLATIIGEFGFIGVLLFLSLFFLMKKYPKKVYHKKLFVTLNLITLFYCLTTPLFMNSFFALILAFGYAHIYNINTTE